MTKEEFICNSDVQKFIAYIANIWHKEFNFNLIIYKGKGYKDNIKIHSLKEAYEKYFWKNATIQNLSDIELSGQNNFQDSMKILEFAKNKIINTNYELLKEESVKEGTKIVFKWGGVYKKGNKEKVEGAQEFNFTFHYQKAIDIWKEINEQKSQINLNNCNVICNSAFTKVYSLILNDFIIYDSRVSVALAYLIDKYFESNFPICLKLFIPPSNITNKDQRKVNNFFESVNYGQYDRHFYSNIKASIILSKAMEIIKETDKYANLEQLGAALFMIGYDIRNNNL